MAPGRGARSSEPLATDLVGDEIAPAMVADASKRGELAAFPCAKRSARAADQKGETRDLEARPGNIVAERRRPSLTDRGACPGDECLEPRPGGRIRRGAEDDG